MQGWKVADQVIPSTILANTLKIHFPTSILLLKDSSFVSLFLHRGQKKKVKIVRLQLKST
jgi:hypothetical protein